MKFNLASGLLLVLATSEAVGASNWFSKAGMSPVQASASQYDWSWIPADTLVYNRWHESELERWLSDHHIPYPSPADRRDLENLVKGSWDTRVQKPMGEMADSGLDQFHHAREWIFDTWSESQLRAFLERHGIPVAQPRRRDILIRTARDNYEAIADKLGEATAYPGNWVYEQWTESEMKEWLDERGWPAPQPTTRDQLIASIRRNGRLASLQSKAAAASASKSAVAAQSTLTEELFNAWSDSQLKKFLDEHNIKVPQGSKRNELLALARKHRHSVLEQASAVSQSAADYLGAATSRAGNEYARATDDAKLKAHDAFDSSVETWSNTRLKAFLDARGVPVPQAGKRDQLLAKVRQNRHRLANQWNAYTFETWHTEELKHYLSSMNAKASHRADVSRDELIKQAQDTYAKASKAGGSNMASATSYMTQATKAAKDTSFDNWSRSELKRYLDNYGVPVYQGTSLNELRATARRHAQYFRYGTNSPQGALVAKLQETAQWVLDQLKFGASNGRAQGQKAADAAREKAEETVEEVRSEL